MRSPAGLSVPVVVLAIKIAQSGVSNQVSNYDGGQTGAHPVRHDPGPRSIRIQDRPPGLLHTEEVTSEHAVVVCRCLRHDLEDVPVLD